MTIDPAAALRRIKPEKHRAQLESRPVDQLVSASDLTGTGRPTLLLDTNVYILSAAGRLPAKVAEVIDRSLLFHCSICLGELATGVANADPSASRWKAVVAYYRDLLASLPATRVLVPDKEIWMEAGLIAGTLARTQNFQPYQRKECLNDALIFLTAAAAGLPVLTSNRREFDLIGQVVPWGRFIHF